MVFDSARSDDVLFGGLSSSGAALGDTWTWSGTNWTQLSLSSAPPARSGAVMAYDPALGETILYGGLNQSGVALGDTWAFNGSSWASISTSGSPGPVTSASMVYDPSLSKLVFFGGDNTTGAPLAGTWTFDGTHWVQLSPSASPPARGAAAMAYDATASNIVLFGGTGTGGTVLDDTWTFNGAAWAAQSPYASPVALSHASAAYDSPLDGVVLVGGANSAGVDQNQAYYYNAATSTWEMIYNNQVMASRQNTVMAPAAGNGQLVVFGGSSAYPSVLGDTEIFDWGHNGAATGDATFPVPGGGDQTSTNVDLGTGNLYTSHQLWDIAGTGIDNAGYAFYNSQSGYSFDSELAHVSPLPNGWVLVDFLDGTNGTLIFTKTGATTFSAPAGTDATLVYCPSASGGACVTAGTYVLTANRSQVSYTFSATGYELESITDRNHNTITVSGEYAADDRGRNINGTQTTSGSNTVTTWADSGLGRTWTETEPTGATADTSITDANGAATTYTYNSASELTAITTPAGRKVIFGYDNNNRVDSATQVTNPTAGTGPTTTFAWGPVPAGTTVPAGTVADHQVVVTDPNGHATTYIDDYAGQTIATIDALGHHRDATYSPDRHPTSLIDAASPAGTTTMTYNANNDMTSLAVPASASGQTPATDTFGYATPSTVTGAAYLPSTATDPQGNCQASGYDSAGNPQTVTSGLAPSNCSSPPAGSNTTTAAYQGDGTTSCGAKTGEICSLTDPDGHTTTYRYDTLGEPTGITPPAPQGPTATTYDADSRVKTVTHRAGGGTAGTVAPVQTAATQISAGGEPSVTVSFSQPVAAGDTIVLEVGSNGGVSPQPTVTSVSGGGVATWNKGAAIAGSAGDEELWYGLSTGSATSVTATMSAGTSQVGAYAIELAGVAASSPLDVAATTTQNASSAQSPTLTTTVAGDYVVMGVNTDASVTGSPGSPWTDYTGQQNNASANDGYNNPLAAQVAANTGSFQTSWAVSSGGNVGVAIALKPAATTATTVTYTYDNDDRITRVESCTGTTCPAPTQSNSVAYTYDNDGHLTTMVDATGTTTYSYDALGRLTEKTLSGDADACTGQTGITYSYDPASNLATMCDSAGTTTYGYDADNDLSSLTEPGGTTGCAISPQHLTAGCSAFGYDNDGRRTLTQFPGGATETTTYLPSGATSSIVAKTAAGAVDTDYTYTYNTSSTDTSLVQTRVENDPATNNTPVTVTYHYDTLNRVTAAVASTGTSHYYAYDPAGNRTCAQTSPCGSATTSYNAANEITNTGYAYDPAGNLTATPTLALAYNSRNQTATVTPSTGGPQNYTYTGTGSTQRTTAGNTTLIPSGPGGTEVDQATTNSVATTYIYDPDGNLIGYHTDGTSFYYLHDNIGSVVAVITATGSICNRYTYDPYGNQTVLTADMPNPFGYAGGYTDTTGLIHYGNRYYNPTTGTWTQPDPTGQNPGYVYAADDPVILTDPTGECFIGLFGSHCNNPIHSFITGACSLGSQLFAAFGATGGATVAGEAGINAAEFGASAGLTAVAAAGSLVTIGAVAGGIALCNA